MSSGTLVKVERYYNRFHLHSLEDLREQREKAIKELEAYWSGVYGLMMATPKDICPKDVDEPAAYIAERLVELREAIDECNYRIRAYYDIEEGWETREED